MTRSGAAAFRPPSKKTAKIATFPGQGGHGGQGGWTDFSEREKMPPLSSNRLFEI
jgi:hypothetical protein